ncbi:MAG: MMPL family transporter [Flavobacteriales bacterium]|nr:MMPL family transporter [Flavobacteriales bacterium]
MSRRLGILAIIAIVSITAVSLIPLRNLGFDFNLEQFFPVDDPDLEFYKEFNERFRADIDDEYIYIGLTNETGIFDSTFLNKVDTLTKFIFNFDSVLSVYSVTNSSYSVVWNGRLYKSPLIHYTVPQRYMEDSVRLFNAKEIKEFLVSKDGKSVAISAFTTPNLDRQAQYDLIESIRSEMERLGFDRSYLTAKILVEQTYLTEIKRNLRVYLSISFLLVSIILLVLFRSYRTVVMALLAIVFSIIWTLALIALCDRPIDIISSLLPPVLAVICLSDVIHIYSKYIEELRKGAERTMALRTTFKDIGSATLFTSLTTAVGFYSLAFSNVMPIRLFGIFAGTGVLLAFIIVIVFIFAASANSSAPRIVGFKQYEERWGRFLSACLRTVIRRRIWFLGATALLTILSLFPVSNIQVNSSLLLELPKHSAILEDYHFVETQFSGTRPFEMALTITDTSASFFDLGVVREIDELNAFLHDSCNVGMMVSHVSFIKSALQAYSAGKSSGYRVPDSEGDIYYLSNKIMQTEYGGEFLRYVSLDKKNCRVSGRLPDLTTVEFEALADRFDRYFQSKKDRAFEYKLTGSGVLIDKTTYSLPRNMFFGLLIVFCVISLIVGGLFRSVKMVVIVLIANIIPLLFMAAVMGMMGIYLKADTSIIFAIAFGIVVDDSIHFISRVKIELSKGRQTLYAIKRAYLSTGKAMIVTTVLLLAGFVPLLFSSFGGTYYIGLLVSLCLVFALIMDLTVLPLLILLCYRSTPKTAPAIS